ncbi:hypothetical protein QYM36_010434 [Artemia franciscana]|uniref:WHEP-TRS domain-containing protein n=1 Tax=Artemia franciscana TaxID=6661 RepID=A0AA88I5R2_ARTSF|nr:hypothetical protein QYM36_010434 [Artemia franciscana]
MFIVWTKADEALLISKLKRYLPSILIVSLTISSKSKPGAEPVVITVKSTDQINTEIAAQRDKVRDMNSKNADKAVIDSAVKTLLAMKKDLETMLVTTLVGAPEA